MPAWWSHTLVVNMSDSPNMWRDQDEFSVARRTKFHQELMRWLEKHVAETRPEPQEPPQEVDPSP